MALPAGSVRSPAKPRMRDLCQCGIGAPSKKILYRCLEVGDRKCSGSVEQRCRLSAERCVHARILCVGFTIKKTTCKHALHKVGVGRLGVSGSGRGLILDWLQEI